MLKWANVPLLWIGYLNYLSRIQAVNINFIFSSFIIYVQLSLSIRWLLNKDVDLDPKELFQTATSRKPSGILPSYSPQIPLIFIRPKRFMKSGEGNIWIPYLSCWNEQAETEDQLSTEILRFNYKKLYCLKKDWFFLFDLLYKHPSKQLVKQPQHPHQQPQHPHQQLMQFQQLQLHTQFKWQPCQQTQTYFLVRERVDPANLR